MKWNAAGLTSIENTFEVPTCFAIIMEKQPTPANILTTVSLGLTIRAIRDRSNESLGEK
jgi:hypothetical protein